MDDANLQKCCFDETDSVKCSTVLFVESEHACEDRC